MGWNLPPGCTQEDIDRAMGGYEPHCAACGSETDELEKAWVRGRIRALCGRCVYFLEASE